MHLSFCCSFSISSSILRVSFLNAPVAGQHFLKPDSFLETRGIMKSSAVFVIALVSLVAAAPFRPFKLPLVGPSGNAPTVATLSAAELE